MPEDRKTNPLAPIPKVTFDPKEVGFTLDDASTTGDHRRSVMKTGIEALPSETQEAIQEAMDATPPEVLEKIQASVEAGEPTPQPDPVPADDPNRMITLLVPDGAWDYPIAHGEQSFYPRRLQTDQRYPNAARDFGGPWVVDVPFSIYHHFLGTAGFRVYEG